MDLRHLFENVDNAQAFKAGEIVIAEETAGDVMYVILEGELEVWIGGELVNVIGPGDIVGEMALIDKKARSATALAKTDCRLAPVTEKRFLFMVQQTPFFALHVMRIIVERLRRMAAMRRA